jgi:L-2-hydroxyglutarate oxidase LhgO
MLRVVVVEKEAGAARHQTGHNSGVIHSGLYYRPGSLKARTCLDGARQLLEFCRRHEIPFELCGKVVVATEPDEIPRLQELHRRGMANGVNELRWLNPEQLHDIEPHAAGIQALQVAGTGIIDFSRVAQTYARVFEERGGTLLLNHKVRSMERTSPGIRLDTSRGTLVAKALINCGGLYADRLARMAGLRPPCRIVPFRGEYHALKAARRHLVRHLIYPVPDPRFPFLGVHFTRMLDGRREAGPNAVLAWAREGYRKSTVHAGELAETLAFPGFWRLVARYAGGTQEMALYSKTGSRLQRWCPRSLPRTWARRLRVRAQALIQGTLMTFVITSTRPSIQRSPAATSSSPADHPRGGACWDGKMDGMVCASQPKYFHISRTLRARRPATARRLRQRRTSWAGLRMDGKVSSARGL